MRQNRSRLSTRGLERGSKEWREVMAHNARIHYRQKKAGRVAAKPQTNFGWSGMTPEERSAEMRRRQELARIKRKKEEAPNSARTRWRQSTKAERDRWKKAMAAGRARAAAERGLVNGAA